MGLGLIRAPKERDQRVKIMD